MLGVYRAAAEVEQGPTVTPDKAIAGVEADAKKIDWKLVGVVIVVVNLTLLLLLVSGWWFLKRKREAEEPDIDDEELSA